MVKNMKLKWKYLTGFAVGIIVLTSVLVPVLLLVRNNELVKHDPIQIWGDEDFAAYDLPGTGTQSDPYRIANYNITTDNLYCIYISDTTKYFIIENCFLETSNNEGYGVYFSDTAEGTGKISKTNINNCLRGIGLFESSGNSIIDSSITLCIKPLDFYKSNSTNLIGNYFSCYEETYVWHSSILSSYSTKFMDNVVLWNKHKLTIDFENSDDMSFIQNDLQSVNFIFWHCNNLTFVQNQGLDCNLHIVYSQSCNISYNQIKSLYISDSLYSEIRSNSLIEFDFSLLSYVEIDFYTFEDNYVNNKKMEFFIEDNGLSFNTILSDYGRIFFIGCSDVTISNPTPVEGILPIDILYCSNLVISDVYQELDLFFSQSDSCLVTDTNIVDLRIDLSEKITISESHINVTDVYLYILNNITLSNNYIITNYISFYDCSNITLTGNEITVDNILFSQVFNFIIRDNNISDCVEGLYFDGISDSTISNNIIEGMTNYGIQFGDFYNVTFSNNSIINSLRGLILHGTSLDQYLFSTFSNNSFDGKNIGYYTSIENLVIDSGDFAQLFFINCTNLLIEDINITNSPYYIRIDYCDQVTIVNVTCENSFGGIYAQYTEILDITNCTFTNIASISIYVIECPSASIMNNSANSGDFGIYLSLTEFAQILNNSIENTLYDGIVVYRSQNCSIEMNTVSNSTGYGILIYQSGFCNVTYNLLKDSFYWGVSLHDSDYNQVHHNAFINNNWQTIEMSFTSQAHDSGQNNLWFDSVLLEGNFYDNWSGSGEYAIDGGALNSDPYPLLTNPL